MSRRISTIACRSPRARGGRWACARPRSTAVGRSAVGATRRACRDGRPRPCSWCSGTSPGNNTSAGKRRSRRARSGNPTLRATLAECAHAATRTTGSQFHGYHRALAARLGYKRAILATAHKLLRVRLRSPRTANPAFGQSLTCRARSRTLILCGGLRESGQSSTSRS